MEIVKLNLFLVIFVILTACSNSPELEKGEIKVFQIVKSALNQKSPTVFVNSRNILSRKQIDNFAFPILFVELETGQNGTLTQYPGRGVGQTWLAADGATLTLERGIIKATRGMGDDIMGVTSSMPPWRDIIDNTTYFRTVSYLSGDNKLQVHKLSCTIRKNNKNEIIKIWDLSLPLRKYVELCTYNDLKINNVYYLDNHKIVRKSLQYVSGSVGYIVTERIDKA